MNSFYPVIMTSDIQKEAQFFRDLFGFTDTFTSDWYISLVKDEQHELAIIDSNHETIPEQYRTASAGILLNMEVTDAREVYTKVQTEVPTTLIQEIRDEDFGQRHFIIESPSHVLIDVIEIIPPSREFIEMYNL